MPESKIAVRLNMEYNHLRVVESVTELVEVALLASLSGVEARRSVSLCEVEASHWV